MSGDSFEMRKVMTLAVVSFLFSSTALADGHGHGHRKHHRHHHDHYVEVERAYYPERVGQYAPVPASVPRAQVYDQRSTSGLVGGAVGSAVGYEISRGNPLGVGIGAAAGALVGNSMNR